MNKIKTRAISLKEAIALLKAEGQEKITLSGEIFYRVACWLNDVTTIDLDGRWEHTVVPCPFIDDLVVDVDDLMFKGKLTLIYERRTVNTLDEDPMTVHVVSEILIGDYHFINAGGPQCEFTRKTKSEETDEETFNANLSCEHPWDDIDDEEIQNFDVAVDIVDREGTKVIGLTHNFDGYELLKKALGHRVLTSFSRTSKNIVIEPITEPKKLIYGFQLTIGWIYATNVWWLIGHEFNDGKLTTFKKLKRLAKVDDNIKAVIQEILFLEDVLGNAPINMRVGADRFFLTVHLY